MFQSVEKLWALFQLLGLFPLFVMTMYYQIIASHLRVTWDIPSQEILSFLKP